MTKMIILQANSFIYAPNFIQFIYKTVQCIGMDDLGNYGGIDLLSNLSKKLAPKQYFGKY